jgi:hypothetical protein
MNEAVFIRIEGESKDRTLEKVVRDLAESSPNNAVSMVSISSLEEIPLAPFAYMVGEGVRHLFTKLLPFEGEGRTLKQGLATADDFRFVRAAWETHGVIHGDPSRIWFPFAKGGSYSPFYADIFLMVNWGDRGAEIRCFGDPKGIKPLSRPQNINYYFRPGLTWPLRTQSGLALRAVAAGCVFGHKGPCAFFERDDSHSLLSLLALTTSKAFRGLVEIQMAFGSYEVGVLQRTVVPSKLSPRLADLALGAWTAKRRADTANLTSHAFFKPALARPETTIAEGVKAWSSVLQESNAALNEAKSKIDEIAFGLYGLSEGDRCAIERVLGSDNGIEVNEANQDLGDVEEEATDTVVEGSALVSELIDYALGSVFGRWDIRCATGERPLPDVPDPFAQLPMCPPGMLQSDDGMPFKEEIGRQSLGNGLYPIDIVWDGILVNDPEHSLDIERHVHAALTVLWGDRADVMESEACTLLGVPSLRDWFCRPVGFFDDHQKRHSKSRRQAPIYWPLTSLSGSYSVWLYYHRLQKDTFYRCLEVVKEKLKYEEARLDRLRAECGVSPDTHQRKGLFTQGVVVDDIRAFQEVIVQVAPLWNPNLNDGVIINFAPLWRLIANKPWQKAVKACWDELVEGNCDWSHLAMHLWPERVIPKCAEDRSLAIAHSLEDVFWHVGSDGKWVNRKVPARTIEDLLSERASAAVKSALKSLLDAPVNIGRKVASKGGGLRKASTFGEMGAA